MPDNKRRIKIKEVFSHPWALELEKEKKEEIRKKSNEEKEKEKAQINTSKELENIKALCKQSTQPVILSNINLNKIKFLNKKKLTLMIQISKVI